MTRTSNQLRQTPMLADDFDEMSDERPHVGARYRTNRTPAHDHYRRDLTQAAHLLSKGYILGQE